MKIYKVYEYATSQETYFQTKAKAKKYIQEYYKENNPDKSKSYDEFIEEQGIELIDLVVE
jgi:hypothetical protein